MRVASSALREAVWAVMPGNRLYPAHTLTPGALRQPPTYDPPGERDGSALPQNLPLLRGVTRHCVETYFGSVDTRVRQEPGIAL